MSFPNHRGDSLIRRTACARAQFSGCSSTTNAQSETGQMVVCSQDLTLGVLCHSALSGLVGALFKKFGLFLNNTRMFLCHRHLEERNFTHIFLKLLDKTELLKRCVK